MAARTKGFARKLAAERLAESLGVSAPAQSGGVKAIPLRILPLIAPHRSKGLYTIRIERVPQLARLSRGRNNGNGSWSLTPEEIDGVEYIGPDSAMERLSLALRLLDNEGGTIAMLELPLDVSEVEDLGRESVDQDYLRRLTDELQSARNALAEREKELSELRQSPREDGDMQRRLDSAAQMAQEQAKTLWQDDERARFAAAEARWREASGRAAAEAQAKAAAAISDAQARAAAQIAEAERGFQDRLAAAETKARDAAAAQTAGQAASAEATRLRGQVAGLEATLKRRDEDYALLRRDAAAAQQRAKDDLAVSEKQWQVKSADELKRLTARAETAERALAGNRDAQGSRDAEQRALQQKLADSDRALAAARDAQAARDTELRTLRDERTALQDRLADADAEAAAKGMSADAIERQVEAALSSARQKWEADAAEQKARSESAAASSTGPSPADIARQIETALAAAKTEWQAGEVQRIAAAEAKIRAGLPPPAMPKGATPEAVQQQIEAALATAKTAWKAEEAARFTQAEEKWRTDSGAALGRLTKRAEAAEAALADARSAPPPPPMVAAPPPAAIDQGILDNLHHEIDELRKALSDREVETAQLKLALDARRLVPEPKPKFYPEPRHAPEREMRVHDPRRSSGKLIKEVAFVFGVIAFLFVGFPFLLPYLPYEVQDSVAQMQASVFGTVPAGYSTAPAKPAAAGAATAAAAGAPAVLARSANVRAAATSSADVVTRLKKGDPVIALEEQGAWTHIKTANIDGWVATSYLKK